MKRFVINGIWGGAVLAAATLVAVAITGTGAAGAYFFMIGFGAIALTWERLREVWETRDAPKERSGADRNKGSR
jgi:O-antigen ligase